ncbi:MAG: hypothetical protein HW380_707 [Magnetococcales bacterium]|nr:hypothetical protein [Magnetococcales bacterium]
MELIFQLSPRKFSIIRELKSEIRGQYILSLVADGKMDILTTLYSYMPCMQYIDVTQSYKDVGNDIPLTPAIILTLQGFVFPLSFDVDTAIQCRTGDSQHGGCGALIAFAAT